MGSNSDFDKSDISDSPRTETVVLSYSVRPDDPHPSWSASLKIRLDSAIASRKNMRVAHIAEITNHTGRPSTPAFDSALLVIFEEIKAEKKEEAPAEEPSDKACPICSTGNWADASACRSCGFTF